MGELILKQVKEVSMKEKPEDLYGQETKQTSFYQHIIWFIKNGALVL